MTDISILLADGWGVLIIFVIIIVFQIIGALANKAKEKTQKQLESQQEVTYWYDEDVETTTSQHQEETKDVPLGHTLHDIFNQLQHPPPPPEPEPEPSFISPPVKIDKPIRKKRHHIKQGLFSQPNSVVQAIIMAEVLGPCKANRTSNKRSHHHII